MSKHVIVGAGPVGTSTAQLLLAQGHDVRVVTRSGTIVEGAESVRADASDRAALARAAKGADALYNCVNPPYQKWPELWPPVAAAMLHAAEQSGAVLVTMSNLYGYGPVDHPMRETDPLAATFSKGRVRADMWRDALAAHDAGRIRATEARASDFVGPGVLDSSLGERVVPKVLAGKSVSVLGDPDAPHSVTYMPDVARTLATLGTDPRAWGQPWHVPSAPAVSQREVVGKLCSAAGVAPVKVKGVPRFALRAMGVAVPMMRELVEVLYQFEQPFVIDSSHCTETFGIEATPLDEVASATVGWFRQHAAA